MKICDYTDVEVQRVEEEGARGVSIRLVISEDDGAENFHMRVFDVEPGGHTPFHQHVWEHEVFVLDGETQVMTEDGKRSAPAGSVVFVRPGERHQFRNESDAVARFICVVPRIVKKE